LAKLTFARTLASASQSVSASTPPEIRSKWRRSISVKAQRRRMIKAHNYRMRARAIKKQREDSHA
jgi:hypothetical protein